MNTSTKIKNILDTIKTLSPEDKNLLVQQLQNKEEENISADNPWIKLAGKYENDSMYDEVVSYIEEYRHELDTQEEDKNISIDNLK